MSLPEIAAGIEEPVSSIAADLRALVQLGYLHHDRSMRTYAPSVRLAQLGGWVASRYAIDSSLTAAAAAIGATTGENVAIACRNDIRMQYLHFVPGHELAPVVKIGTTRLLCHAGLGWALLATLNARSIQSIVRRTNALLAAEDMVEISAIEAVVETCRRTGYVHAEHTVRVGYGVIAMPLAPERGRLAVGISGPVDRLRQNETTIVSEMRRALRGWL